MRAVAALPVTLAALTACAGAPQQIDSSFDLADAIAAGFSPVASAPLWHAGDEAIFRVEVDDRSGTTTMYVRLQLLPPPGSTETPSQFPRTGGSEVGGLTFGRITETMSYDVTYTFGEPNPRVETDHMVSAVLYFAVEVYDGSGEFQDASTSKVPESFLTKGFSKVCHALLRRSLDETGQTAPAQDLALAREYFQGIFALVSLLQIIENNEALAPVLWQVLDRPSFLSVLFRGGAVNMSIQGLEDPPAEVVHRFPEPAGYVTGFEMPLVLTLNGKPALRLKLGVCESLPPFLITGGIVKVEGVHASRPERRIRLEMVASRVGSGQGFLHTFGD